MALYHKDRLISATDLRPLGPRPRWPRGLSLVVLGLAAAAAWAVIYALIEFAHYLWT
jgi:hypothetical protein